MNQPVNRTHLNVERHLSPVSPSYALSIGPRRRPDRSAPRNITLLNSSWLRGTLGARYADKSCITVWTVGLVHTVLTATSQSNGNGQTSTPHRIQTP